MCAFCEKLPLDGGIVMLSCYAGLAVAQREKEGQPTHMERCPFCFSIDHVILCDPRASLVRRFQLWGKSLTSASLRSFRAPLKRPPVVPTVLHASCNLETSLNGTADTLPRTWSYVVFPSWMQRKRWILQLFFFFYTNTLVLVLP